ncbi:MAG TPA: hypothetical protein VNL15_05585, partial [Dehalococcoidia bacterium]|nr:hypothetical protein [Dehalococcoidia bacterium]
MPTSADVLIARHFFSPHEAGLYAGVATLGRIILFLPASISLVLFPKIAHDSAKGGSGQGFLRTGLGLTFVLSGSATLLFLLAPRLVLRTALGGEYVGADNLLPLYAIASFLFSLVIFLLYFHLARRQFSYLYLVLLPHIVAEFLLPYAFHSSAEQLAGVLIFVNMSLLVFSLAFTRLSQEGPIPITKRILTPLREFQADRL